MINFKTARQAASYYIQSAHVAEGMGDISESLRLFELAFEAEKQGALFLLSDFDNEPARSVLFRSAAALALKCKKYGEATKMVYFGLAGNPPDDIANELAEVYEAVLEAIDKLGDDSNIILRVSHKRTAKTDAKGVSI